MPRKASGKSASKAKAAETKPATEEAPAGGNSGTNAMASDSETLSGTMTAGEVPSMSSGNILVSTGHALSNQAHNATEGQMHTSITWQTATIQGLNSLFSIGEAIIGRTAKETMDKGESPAS